MLVFKSYVPPSSAESIGGNDGSGGKLVPVASLRRCGGVLLVRLILQTLEREGS